MINKLYMLADRSLRINNRTTLMSLFFSAQRLKFSCAKDKNIIAHLFSMIAHVVRRAQSLKTIAQKTRFFNSIVAHRFSLFSPSQRILSD